MFHLAVHPLCSDADKSKMNNFRKKAAMIAFSYIKTPCPLTWWGHPLQDLGAGVDRRRVVKSSQHHPSVSLGAIPVPEHSTHVYLLLASPEIHH
jgi:hypothetical protein